jgi:transposase
VRTQAEDLCRADLFSTVFDSCIGSVPAKISFTNSVAFLGLNVRVKESGSSSGRRKSTKQGDPEIRCLLDTASMAASRQAVWKPFYQRHLACGLKPTQALVALARKLARAAFAIITRKTEYQTRTVNEACYAT